MMGENKSALRTMAVAGLLVSIMLATALGQTGRIAGTISDAGGKTIPGAAAVLFSQDGGTELKRAETDASGRYEFAGVANGAYRIGASAAGYIDAAMKLVILTGALRTVDVMLTATPEKGKENSLSAAADAGVQQPLVFAPSGVRGTIAPSGYSTGLSSEETAQVNHNVSELRTDPLSSFAFVGSAGECSQEHALQHAVELDRRSYQANRELGMFYLRHRDFGRSVKYLQAAKELAPEDDGDTRDLAVALLGANRAKDAAVLLEQVVAKHGRDASLTQLLAIAYERAGDAAKARVAFLRAAALDTNTATAFDCGMGLIRLDAVEDARNVLAAATAVHTASAKLWMALGVADDLLEHKAAAVAELLRAIEMDPDYEPTYGFLANLAVSVPGKEADIRKQLAEFVVRRPESDVAHLDYALAMWKQHQLDTSVSSDAEIIVQLKMVLAKQPKLSRAHFVLGDVYVDSGQLAQAEQEFRAVVDSEPQNAAARYRLAQIYRKQGRIDLAAVEMGKFRSLYGKPVDGQANSTQSLQELSFESSQAVSAATVQCPRAPE